MFYAPRGGVGVAVRSLQSGQFGRLRAERGRCQDRGIQAALGRQVRQGGEAPPVPRSGQVQLRGERRYLRLQLLHRAGRANFDARVGQLQVEPRQAQPLFQQAHLLVRLLQIGIGLRYGQPLAERSLADIELRSFPLQLRGKLVEAGIRGRRRAVERDARALALQRQGRQLRVRRFRRGQYLVHGQVGDRCLLGGDRRRECQPADEGE